MVVGGIFRGVLQREAGSEVGVENRGALVRRVRRGEDDDDSELSPPQPPEPTYLSLTLSYTCGHMGRLHCCSRHAHQSARRPGSPVQRRRRTSGCDAFLTMERRLPHSGGDGPAPADRPRVRDLPVGPG